MGQYVSPEERAWMERHTGVDEPAWMEGRRTRRSASSPGNFAPQPVAKIVFKPSYEIWRPATTSWAASIPPGAIYTQPGTKIVFNSPYDEKKTYHMKIVNWSARRIGWAIKTTNIKRLVVDPSYGVLNPKEDILMAVSCDALGYAEENSNNDRITIVWTNAPDGPVKEFRHEWFQRDGMVRRKNLPIEYNR